MKRTLDWYFSSASSACRRLAVFFHAGWSADTHVDVFSVTFLLSFDLIVIIIL